MTEKMLRLKYIGGHSEVENTLTGLWKRNEVKELPEGVALQLLSHPKIFKKLRSRRKRSKQAKKPKEGN